MEGTQIVDAEVIPPDNDDNGEDQRILVLPVRNTVHPQFFRVDFKVIMVQGNMDA